MTATATKPNKHTIEELKELQSKTLAEKVQITTARIIEWYEHWNGKVVVSFSGGKDSTVLLDIARKIYPDMQGFYVDTGLEYPELREFVKKYDNIIWQKPKMTFKQVIEKYGYPFISKEASECIHGAKIFLKHYMALPERERANLVYSYSYDRLTGRGAYSKETSLPIRVQQTNGNSDISSGRGCGERKRECEIKNDDGGVP